MCLFPNSPFVIDDGLLLGAFTLWHFQFALCMAKHTPHDRRLQILAVISLTLSFGYSWSLSYSP